MQDFEKHKTNFFNFVDRIAPDEKVAILAHANCVDGMGSAVFMVEILKKKYPALPSPSIHFIAYSTGVFDRFSNTFENDSIKKVFVLDFNADMDMFEEFERFRDKFDVLFVDHHPLNPKLILGEKIIKTHKDDCTSLVIYRFGEEIIEEDWNWLACVAAVSEFSWKNEKNLKFIQNNYPDYIPGDEDSDLLKLVGKMGSLVTYYSKDSLKAYEIILNKDFDKIEEIHREVGAEVQRCLDDFEKNAEKHFDGHLYFYFFKSRFSLGSKMSTILSIRHKGSTIITFSEVEGTDMLKVSARNNADNIIYTMNNMLEYCVNGLERAMGGGHPNASGGNFLAKDLDTFKARIIKFVKNKLESK